MRTTLNIDERLLISAKHLALEQMVPLAQVVENALRETLNKPRSIKKRKVRLVTAKGCGVKPGIDLDNSSSLLDIMDGSS